MLIEKSDLVFIIISVAILVVTGVFLWRFIPQFLIPWGMYVAIHFALFLDFNIPQKQKLN